MALRATLVRKTWNGREEGREYVLLQLFRDFFVDRAAEVFDRALPAFQHDWCRVIRRESTGLRVDTHEVERFPHYVNELVDVEPVF